MFVNAGGLVYGTILVATLLAAESAVRETYARTVSAVVLALFAYWLTIAYSHYAGERLEREEGFEAREFGRTAVREMTLLVGATVPLVVILVFWATGGALGNAVIASSWCAVGAIIAIEVVIGVRADLKGWELVRQTGVGALLGALVVAMRVILH